MHVKSVTKPNKTPPEVPTGFDVCPNYGAFINGFDLGRGKLAQNVMQNATIFEISGLTIGIDSRQKRNIPG